MPPMHFEDSPALCKYIAEQTGGKALLSFSAGKDSIACWLQMRKYFKEIYPVYMYLVPDLEFVEEGLRYFEDFFGTKIMRLPHPSLYRWLNYKTFQAPQNLRAIEDAGLPVYDEDFVFEVAAEDFGLDPETHWTAIGVRSADSPNRRTSIMRFGPLNQQRRAFYPVYDWKIKQLVDELDAAGVRLPSEYKVFGRSFDGLDYRFLKGIKDHYPRDYARILEWFPLADLELFRHEIRERYYANAS